jgi:hypothetical protein
MTQLAIDSLKSQTGVRTTIIIVESGNIHEYNGAICVKYEESTFNYNVALTFGYNSKPLQDYDFYVFLNNDIVAESNCLSEMCKFNAISVSPQNPLLPIHSTYRRILVGYNTIEHFCGWCICFRSDFLQDNLSVLLPRDIPYYCQDTWIAECLLYAGVPHFLIKNAKLLHVGGVSAGKNCVSADIQQQIAKYEETRISIGHTKKRIKYRNRGILGLIDHWIYCLHEKM